MTPFERADRLSSYLGVDLRLKRDDLFPFSGGGNKARKIEYLIARAKKEGSNAIVTCGDIQSNHLRVTSMVAAKLGWKIVAIIHDSKYSDDNQNGNFYLTSLAGADVIYCEKNDISIYMDNAMLKLADEGYKPFYIWGGGHSLEGTLAYRDAVIELKSQMDNINWDPDYIILASGTGGTQAGIHVGCAELGILAKVIGISIAREYEYGKNEIQDSIAKLSKYIKFDANLIPKVNFRTEWLLGGYGCYDTELLDLIRWILKMQGLPCDPTYTGKAFSGLISMIKNGEIKKESKVLFWHTGGLLNLISNKIKVKE